VATTVASHASGAVALARGCTTIGTAARTIAVAAEKADGISRAHAFLQVSADGGELAIFGNSTNEMTITRGPGHLRANVTEKAPKGVKVALSHGEIHPACCRTRHSRVTTKTTRWEHQKVHCSDCWHR
jgi:hypothetical protein